ncbi:hypothetical protein [Ravibacter arvi]
MKKLFFFDTTLLLFTACSQQNIEPSSVNDEPKPPKTTCGGAECAPDR